jgi:glycosyltransferase involved in cell wall biosynthesis
MDLVVVSLERWDDVWRRNQHLVSRLLTADKHLRVLFVEPPADPLHDILNRRAPARGSSPAPIDGYAGRLLRFRPVKVLPRRIDGRTDERLARSVMKAAEKAEMRHPVLWLNDPAAAALSVISGWPTLYDITDDWIAADRPAAELHRVRTDEEWLLQHAAEVVVCSPELVRRKRPDRAGTIELIPNGVDAAPYRIPRDRPADLPERSAVYVGTLHRDRLDVSLCVRTAQTLGPTGRLVLVGPVALDATDVSLLADAGVVLLGGRARDEVIAYLQHAHVLVVPHVVTPFTDSLDPIKLYEYQAVGRPVVSTAVAGFREAVGGLIRVMTADAFPNAVAAAISTPHLLPTGPAAVVASWDDRASAMRAVIARIR